MKNKKKRIENRGDKLTFLTEEECKVFLGKYEKLISIECRKISYLPGIGIKDLIQECRIKLISGAHTYEKKRSSEKTWVLNVIRKTLYSVWNAALAEKRVCYIGEKDNGRKPVYDYSFDQPIGGEDSEDQTTYSEAYEDPFDGRPIFGSNPSRPDENLSLVNVLEVLKDRLPEETYAYVRQQISPSSEFIEILKLEEQFRTDLQSEGFNRVRPKKEFDIFFQFSDVSIEKLTMLCQIGEVLSGECGISKEEILKHELMIDANF